MKDRTAQQRAYYLANREKFLERAARYRAALRADPIAWRAHIEKARQYKRRVFGWVRTYRPRRARYETA